MTSGRDAPHCHAPRGAMCPWSAFSALLCELHHSAAEEVDQHKNTLDCISTVLKKTVKYLHPIFASYLDAALTKSPRASAAEG